MVLKAQTPFTSNVDPLTSDDIGSSVGDVVGPGSATNNAIPRFDGTTGKLLQDSGVTITNSDTLNATKVHVSTNHPTDAALCIGDGVGIAIHTDGGANSTNRWIFDANAGTSRIFSFRSDNLQRWAFRVDGTESGSDVGGDFAIRRYNDAGTYIDSIFSAVRSTGMVTIPSLTVTSGSIPASTITGTLGLANGGLGVSLSDPGADRLLFWDDSAGNVEWLTLGTNLSITGTTLNASGGGGGGLSDTDYGDITVSGGGTVMTIDNDVVTYAKIQNVSATDRLLGRVSTGAGDIEEITCTDFAQSLLDDADASAARTTLALGTLATQSGTFSGTSSGTNTGDQNIFSTIAVSGQSDVVADTTGDTLTLVAGSNITITTDAATDSITIAASGGGGGLTQPQIMAIQSLRI